MIVTITRKPTTVQAIRWTGDNLAEVRELTTAQNFRAVEPGTREGDSSSTGEVWDSYHDTWVGVRTGQYVIRGVKGEFYPIDVATLTTTYFGADEASARELDALS